MSQQLPNPETVQESVGKLERFVAYVVEVLRGNNSTRKLLLLDVLIFLIFNPVAFKKILELFGVNNLPNRYAVCFWISVGAVFVAAAVVAWRILPRQKPRRDLAERTAIKGLLPYDTSDAALFARLQRENDLKECSQAITAREFRFGVLCGESGNGKTSFLQAGLQPRLPENGYRCVYVKCTDLEPVEGIRQAFLEELQADKDVLPSTLPEMLEIAVRRDSRPLVLILDQFEQFFVHHPRKKDRAPFLTAMEFWFRRQVTLPVKILVCLRSDFLDRLIELQKLLGYSLGPQQNFQLEKFAPAQAAEIFRVIAAQENLECDSGFVEKLAAEELTSTTDGLVSPVDIQVLAWMIAAQKLEEERAFNEKTFRRLGGVEGLLERFLNRALEARETDARRQSTVKVLLSLTDLDRNTRAGVLTMPELAEKLKSQVAPAEIPEAVGWLSRGDVRLIVPVKRTVGGKEIEGYELSHERLIPALRRIAGKQLSEADRAEHLLDRRANEWLASGRRSRYLFSWSELRLINRHRHLIAWGKDRKAKEGLLAASRRRFLWLASAAGLIVVLAFLGSTMWNSNAWQTWLIKREVRNYGNTVNDDGALTLTAKALLYAGDSQKAFEALNRIIDNEGKSQALVEIADSWAELGEKEKAKELLYEATKSARMINDSDVRANVLVATAESYTRLRDYITGAQLLNEAIDDGQGSAIEDDVLEYAVETAAKLDEENAVPVLTKAIRAVSHLKSKRWKISVLCEIASAYVSLGKKGEAQAVLADAEKLEDAIGSGFDEYVALTQVAIAFGKCEKKDRALKLLQKAIKVAGSIPGAQIVVVESYAAVGETTKDRVVLDEAVKNVGLISEPHAKNRAVRLVARSYVKLGVTTKDDALLAEAVNMATLITESYEKTDVLNLIALGYTNLRENEKSKLLLDEAVGTSRLIDANNYKAMALISIAMTYAKVGEKYKANELLSEALIETRLISQIQAESKVQVLGLIAASYVKLAESDNDTRLYQRTFQLIEGLGSDENRDKVLSPILKTKLVSADVGGLHSIISPYSEVGKAKALARILIAISHPELIEKEKKPEGNPRGNCRDSLRSDRGRRTILIGFGSVKNVNQEGIVRKTECLTSFKNSGASVTPSVTTGSTTAITSSSLPISSS